jgi:hypothetical protein
MVNMRKPLARARDRSFYAREVEAAKAWLGEA